MGHDVTVLTRRKYLPVYQGVKFVALPYVNKSALETITHSMLCTMYAFWHKPDIVHVHNMGACLLLPILKLRRIKVILTIHSLNYQHWKWGKIAKAMLKLCEWIGIHFADRVITVSPDIRQCLKQAYGKHTPIHFIPNGVRPAEIVSAGVVLTKYKLEPKKYVLAVGRITPEKGLEILVNAYNLLSNPDFKLVIVGDEIHPTRYKGHLLCLIEDNPNIVLTGFLFGRELAELYTNAGLFVSTSINEGFPMVVLEAMSYGLPMLLSDIPAHKEIRLAPTRYFKDARELASKLAIPIMLNGEHKQYEAILHKKYDWDAITKAIYDTYC